MLEQKITERRQTLEEFAEYAETYAREHKEAGTLSVRHLQRLASGTGPNGRPLGRVRPATARLLENIFDVSIDQLLATPGPSTEQRDTTYSADADLGLAKSYGWLDEHAGWVPDTSRRKVMSQLSKLNTDELRDQHVRRGMVRRSQIAGALSMYYGDGTSGYDTYSVHCGHREIQTSVLTRPSWLDLACPLGKGNDRLTLTTDSGSRVAAGNIGVGHAVHRLAEAAALGVRVANVPLYRLLSIDIREGAIAGAVGVAPFVEYAVTMDLLEKELVDAVSGAPNNQLYGLPLREKYLPDVSSVLDISGRLCAGGVLALCAIARPADPYRGKPDYALLIQQRSENVLNAARRLAVIPKGFHQPMTDLRGDAQLGSTLLREIEEELFGRGEVDSTAGAPRVAAPLHPGRLSEPMQWLREDSARMRVECTGFGLNLVSGNFEFACLVVIEDDEFWARYGGQVEANWEASGLRLYSSLDDHLVAELMADESWSDEGLFALTQGIRRLCEVGGHRVNLPAVEWS
ncbi:transcriptional regulator [Saccharopolyspora sp. 5N708]|uniref:transcriptional regulator n=1 Tax=Saccharopolyspora sp. 5N708 TaxID=3457424 RepID=UPI003FD69248